MNRLPVPVSTSSLVASGISSGSLSTYLLEVNKIPLLTPEEETKLAIDYRENNNVEAAHKLVTSNLRFVVKIAYEYSSYGLRIADLIQEGNIGLMHAVKKFDPYKGFRLISYAVWWIRAMIQGYILRTWSLVKIGTTQAQRKLFYKLGQTKKKLANFFGESSQHIQNFSEGLAKMLHVRDEDVLEMDARLKARDASLDQPLSAESSLTGLDLLVSDNNQEELLAREEEKTHVKKKVDLVLTSLGEKERFIVEKRLMTDEPMTLQEIGDRYNISRERARQLEERAKKKLRTALEPALSMS